MWYDAVWYMQYAMGLQFQMVFSYTDHEIFIQSIKSIF